MKCVSTTVKTCSGKFQWILLILSLEDSKFLYKILKVTIFLIMFCITEIFLYCFIVRFYQLLFWKPDTYHIQKVWNRDKYHIIWSAKNLIKNSKKELLSIYLNRNQKLELEIIFFMYQYICLAIVIELEPSLHSLAISKWHNWQLDKNYIYIYIYILLWLAKKYSFLYQKMYFHHYFCFLSHPKHISLTIICKTRSITFPKTATSALYYFKS